MGGGDLNLKKEWHPGTLKNQEEVWKVEQKAKEEEQKLEQLKKELEEERQMMELQRLQEKSGRRKRSDRLDWMYNGGPNNQNDITQDKEDFLLGKKSILSLVNNSSSNDVILSNGLNIDQLYNHEREPKPRFERLNTDKTTKNNSVINTPVMKQSKNKRLREAPKEEKRSRHNRSRAEEHERSPQSRASRHSNSHHNRSRAYRTRDTSEERERKIKQMTEDAEAMDKERREKVKRYIQEDKKQEEIHLKEMERSSKNNNEFMRY